MQPRKLPSTVSSEGIAFVDLRGEFASRNKNLIDDVRHSCSQACQNVTLALRVPMSVGACQLDIGIRRASVTF